MRVLYVALTRAKEKLIITGLEKDFEKSIHKKEDLLKSYKEIDGESKINKSILQKYVSYLDWIELVYLKNKKKLDEILDVKIHTKKEITKDISSESKEEKNNIKEKVKNVDLKNVDKIKEKLDWEYEHTIPESVLTKTSVTKIKSLKLNLEEIKEEAKYKEPEFLKKEDKELTGAEKGSIMHLVLKYLDEKEEYTKEKICELVDKLNLSKKEKEAVDIEKIYEFTKSLIWKELTKAREVQREKPFYINIPVKEVYDIDVEEEILVQGIIDSYYINEKGELVLVDYKTDKVNKKEELIDKYKEQLRLYKIALEKALERKVDKVYIYSVYLGEEIEIIF